MHDVIAYTLFQWDCACGEVNEVDHDPTGEEVTCDVCGITSRVAETR